METQKRELYEVFSVAYGNGKSKGWKVQGSEKVHTVKTKTAAYSLSDQMKAQEEKHVQIATQVSSSKSYKSLDVELTAKDLKALKPMKRYYYLMGRNKTCPICGKKKSLWTFLDKKTLEISENCQGCRNKMKQFNETPETIPRSELKYLKPMKRYFYLKDIYQVCPVCGKKKSLWTFLDKETLEIAETCHSCQNVVKRKTAKVEEQEMVEEVVHKVLETSEVLKAIEPLEKAQTA